MKLLSPKENGYFEILTTLERYFSIANCAFSVDYTIMKQSALLFEQTKIRSQKIKKDAKNIDGSKTIFRFKFALTIF